MSDPVETLILDLLEWIGPRERPYSEVMEAWHTSCPRLPVWEEANARGFIERHHVPGRGAQVFVSKVGMAFHEARRPVTTTQEVERAASQAPPLRSAVAHVELGSKDKTDCEH